MHPISPALSRRSRTAIARLSAGCRAVCTGSMPVSGQFIKLTDVEAHLPGNRLNDGFVDASGHLWFGSMDDAEEQPDRHAVSRGR